MGELGDPTVLVDRSRPHVATVTMHQSDTLNALTPRMAGDLTAALDQLAGDDACRVVILTGSGAAFCAGGDIDAMSCVEHWPVQEMSRRADDVMGLAQRVRSMPQPVIAAVNGAAVGGGLSLAVACDTRLCSESARFSAAFVRLGLSGCEMGLSYLLPRIVGTTAAFELMLSGRSIDSAEAARIGLVLQVVSHEALSDAVMAVAERIAGNSPFGVKMTKEVMWQNLSASSLESATALERRTQLLCLRTNDHREAAAAFLEKRPPKFTNT